MSNKDFSFIDLETGDIAYCPRCQKAGIQSKMQDLIQELDKPLPEDADNWSQCHRCGYKQALYEVKREGAWIYPFDTSSNPFDSASTFESGKKRKYKDRLGDYSDKID